MDEWMNAWINQSKSICTNESMNESINQKNSRMMIEWKHKSTDQSIMGTDKSTLYRGNEIEIFKTYV